MFARNTFLSVLLAVMAVAPVLAQSDPAAEFSRRRFPLAVENGKIIEKDGRRLLYGGENPSWAFDITNFRLDVNKLHHGKGREYFAALINPKFESAKETSEWLTDDQRVLVIALGGEVKVYPLRLMIRHEAINDVVGGMPVMPVFCVLADLGSVYDRRMMGHTFTFGVSGYTYADSAYWDGLDAFILWDRDTESLWWPLIGTAVSGPLIDKPLKLLDEKFWSQTTWGRVKARYPGAVVLIPGQTIDPPPDWPKLNPGEIQGLKTENSRSDSLSPRWGGNSSLPQGSGSK